MEVEEATRKRKADEIVVDGEDTEESKDQQVEPEEELAIESAPAAAAEESQDKAADSEPAVEKEPTVSKKVETDENPYDKLKSIVVQNDGRPESMIKLVGLKSLFAKQLPKMPRAYIARLVFDRRHKSLAILSDDPAVKDSDEEIIGGICFRPFEEMRFAEIAFCAVSATHQVKVSGKYQ